LYTLNDQIYDLIGGEMLEVKNLTKKFGSVEALKDLSFNINDGEIVGLIGENGSGKTTTIKIIAGLYQPTEGEVKINNLDIVEESDTARCQIGYIPDEPAVYDKLTGDEFLHFVAEAFDISKEKSKNKIEELKKLFPMEGQTSGFFEDYSRGTRQKFMIIAALLHEPELLLIDEPIVGLDPKSASTATKLFQDFVDKEKHSILLCTHTLSVAERICHRFIILKQGQIIASGNLEQLRKKVESDNASLHEVYLKLCGQNE
jgi:ABC-2 type transport system ATP-binding protein